MHVEPVEAPGELHGVGPACKNKKKMLLRLAEERSTGSLLAHIELLISVDWQNKNLRCAKLYFSLKKREKKGCR